MLSSKEIRQQFVEFFAERGHSFVPSSPVVPYGDPTLLFTNAGMNQFKDVFLATGRRPYSRAANSQKCIRAGGKHNDLEDVGHDTYHHTFFEMLGNWSFGDYFKQEAIRWAWELLTQRWGLDKARLHATVFAGDEADGLERDDEAAGLWRSVTNIDPAHVHRFGRKDNFWEMADTGPCGPCSEIHIDLTSDKSGRDRINTGDPRVMEIWNLVFIQYNRDASGRLTPLPARHVDTGMGFERVAALLQGKRSNYDTDLFTPIFTAIRSVTAAAAYAGRLEGPGDHDPRVMVDVSYRVIADHLRCLVFAVADGAVLSNEGRGYVLRRVLRRAMRYGRQYLGVHEPFLYKLVPAVVDTMGEAFPELVRAAGHITAALRDEEESFGRTYERGVKLFDEAAASAQAEGLDKISGEAVFKLHDTYGFSIDLTRLMAVERGLHIDEDDYERRMDQARDLAREASGSAAAIHLSISGALPATDDAAKYTALEVESTLIGYVQDDRYVTAGPVPPGTPVALLLDRTCFYGEQGGQVGDTGVIRSSDGYGGGFTVEDTRRHGHSVLHIGRLDDGAAPLAVGQTVRSAVSGAARQRIMQNHTATHIMNWALRDVLGGHIDQKGSVVDADRTRFDFSHNHPLTMAELSRIESHSNEQIAADHRVYTAEVPLAEARRVNALRAVFGEKYPDVVRVVSIGRPVHEMTGRPDDPSWMAYSVELCGGTHMASSATVGALRIIEETGVAKGVRRVTAVSGERARDCDLQSQRLDGEMAAAASLPDDQLEARLPGLTRQVNETECSVAAKQALRERLADLQARHKAAAKARARAGAAGVRETAEQLLADARTVGPARLIVGRMPQAGAEQIREAIDFLRDRAGSAGIFLGCPAGDKVLLFASMTDDLVGMGLKAGDLIREVAPLVGGGGGGKPELAQAGGKRPEALDEALEYARQWLVRRLGALDAHPKLP